MPAQIRMMADGTIFSKNNPAMDKLVFPPSLLIIYCIFKIRFEHWDRKLALMRACQRGLGMHLRNAFFPQKKRCLEEGLAQKVPEFATEMRAVSSLDKIRS